MNLDDKNKELLKGFLANNKGDVADVIKVYDQLEPVSLDFMKGRWRGEEIETGHSLDGMLVPSGWYGKLFISPEEVHPLVFFANNKTELYSVNPQYLPMDLKIPKNKALGIFMKSVKPITKTKETSARLRMIEYRGKYSATMCYDAKPINDHFVKIDENTVLGLMDKKGDSPDYPYAFVLFRDDNAKFEMDF